MASTRMTHDRARTILVWLKGWDTLREPRPDITAWIATKLVTNRRRSVQQQIAEAMDYLGADTLAQVAPISGGVQRALAIWRQAPTGRGAGAGATARLMRLADEIAAAERVAAHEATNCLGCGKPARDHAVDGRCPTDGDSDFYQAPKPGVPAEPNLTKALASVMKGADQISAAATKVVQGLEPQPKPETLSIATVVDYLSKQEVRLAQNLRSKLQGAAEDVKLMADRLQDVADDCYLNTSTPGVLADCYRIAGELHRVRESRRLLS